MKVLSILLILVCLIASCTTHVDNGSDNPIGPIPDDSEHEYAYLIEGIYAFKGMSIQEGWELPINLADVQRMITVVISNNQAGVGVDGAVLFLDEGEIALNGTTKIEVLDITNGNKAYLRFWDADFTRDNNKYKIRWIGSGGVNFLGKRLKVIAVTSSNATYKTGTKKLTIPNGRIGVITGIQIKNFQSDTNANSAEAELTPE